MRPIPWRFSHTEKNSLKFDGLKRYTAWYI